MFQINSDYQKKLLKRWAPALEKGEPISDVSQKLTMAQVLENTRKYYTKLGLFTEAGPKPGTPNSVAGTLDGRTPAYTAPINGKGVLTADDYLMPNAIMGMLRRIFPTLMAHELVGVQAMTKSTGVVMAMRALNANHGGIPGLKPGEYEFGYGMRGRTNMSAFTGTNGQYNVDAASDASLLNKTYRNSNAASTLSEFLTGIKEGSYTGHGVATSDGEGFAPNGGYAKGSDAAIASGIGDLTPGFGHWRNNTYPAATIGFVKRFVAAETRKLGSEFTPEDAEDLENEMGLDLETELTNIISYQLGADIDQQIKETMLGAAFNERKTIDVSCLDGLDQMGRIAAMLTFVTKEANEISIKTRRGAGNFVLASTTICSCLQQLGTSKLVSDGKTLPSVPASSIGTMTKEGLINDGRQLLVRDTNTVSSYALVGYKGTTTGDNGIIYCPYIPVTVYKALKPENGLSVIGARTRYGLVDNPYDAENFYSLIAFTGFDTAYSLSDTRRTFFGGAISDASSLAVEGPVMPEGLIG